MVTEGAMFGNIHGGGRKKTPIVVSNRGLGFPLSKENTNYVYFLIFG